MAGTRAAPPVAHADAAVRLDGFIDRFLPEVAAIGREALAILQARLPTAQRLVYDNYNALAVGFSPNGQAGNAIVSIVFYPRWVSLFFLQARLLDDPAGLLRGSGTTARHIVLRRAEDLLLPEIQALLDQALLTAKMPLAAAGTGGLVIKSVSEKQRARRPEKK